jgi:uncharacterized membrane protein required for colicin V production
MVVTPILAMVLVATGAQFTTASATFIVIAYLAMVALVVGIASCICVTFGRSTPIERALGLFFGAVNLMGLNGVLMLFQIG